MIPSMTSSPFRPWLYRRRWRAVICLSLTLSLAPLLPSQSARQPKRVLRALGLLQLAPNGKANLVPIAILVDGKFYDASVYKADPVPMSLDSETVYEAERTGVAQGLFTVTGALQTKDTWIGEGKWQPGGAAPAKARHADNKPRMEEDEGPPRLRKRGAEGPSPPVAPQPPSPPADTQSPTPPASPSSAAPTNPPADASTSSPSPDENDPNRPVLKRGKTQPLGTAQKSSEPATSSTTAMTAASPKPSSSKNDKANGVVQLIPAISDAAGPEPRPYTYDLKPSEESSYRKKMLALAAEAVQARARQIVPVLPGGGSRQGQGAHASAGKPPQPAFDDVQFRAFDLWNTNEPVFILSAQAKMTPGSRSAGSFSDLTYFITVVAKADIYGELRKLLVNATDSQHLDETPRLELIDAVDADGDGRGELLFRQIWDGGVAWAVYRAAADQLYPLFEGTH